MQEKSGEFAERHDWHDDQEAGRLESSEERSVQPSWRVVASFKPLTDGSKSSATDGDGGTPAAGSGGGGGGGKCGTADMTGGGGGAIGIGAAADGDEPGGAAPAGSEGAAGPRLVAVP